MDSNRPRMVKAYKHGWPRLAVHQMAVSKLRKAFAFIRVQGLRELRAEIEQDPRGTLFLPNHSCWWDLFLVHFLNETIPVDGYGMMEHFNMLRFGFFRRIGAFSVDRNDPAAVRESVKYAAGLLDRPRAGVWVFPQGRMAGNDVRPLGFQPGVRAIVGLRERVRVVPVALRYEFWQEERPEAFVRFGEPVVVKKEEKREILGKLEERLTAELDALREDVTAQAAERFVVVMRGGGSIHERYARVRAFFLGKTPGAPEFDEPRVEG